MPNPKPETTNPMDAPMTHRERGIVARTIGAPCDTEYLDDDEAVEYLAGYESDV